MPVLPERDPLSRQNSESGWIFHRIIFVPSSNLPQKQIVAL